jgi:hypothetical protein
MAILEPQQKMLLQEGLGSGESSEHPAEKSAVLVRRNIAFYQGADYVYRHHLNAWQTPSGGVPAVR